MKEGYKLCPFCANEIKEKAIKCQYCGEFLNEKIEEPKIKYRCVCGFLVNEGDKICSHCGVKLDWGKTKLNGEKSKGSGNKNSKFDKIIETIGVICLVPIIFAIIIGFLGEFETSTSTGTGKSNQEVSKTSVNVKNDIKKLDNFNRYEQKNIGTISSPIDYNDVLVDLTSECIVAEDKVWTLYENKSSTTDIRNAINNLLNQCNNAKREINKLGGREGDNSLKDGVIDIIEKEISYYSKFSEVLPYLEKENLTESENKSYESLSAELQTIDKYLSQANDNLITIQESFAKNHGFELEDENYENDTIEDIILGQGIHWGMTFEEIKKTYGLNAKNSTEGFGGAEKYMDLSKYKKISFMDNKGIQVEYQFYYYDNNYRLYKVNNKYNYTANSYNNAKDFLELNFGITKEKNLNGCITCKEGFRYNKGGTSAYLLKDYGPNYLDLKDVIDNFQVQYESDSIVNIINSNG